MKIEQFKILEAIVQTGSLKNAAKLLHKTQPALSIAMQKLESEVGFELLDRNQYRLTLTSQGKVFYKESLLLLHNVRELEKLANILATGNEPKLTIAFEQLAIAPQIHPILTSLIERYPHTEFEVLSGTRFSAIERVSRGEADIGIGAWFDIFHASGDYQSTHIADLEVVVVAKTGMFNVSNITSSELVEKSCLMLKASNMPFDSENLGYAQGARVITIDDISTLKHFLLSGLGWAIVAKSMFEHEILSSELTVLTLTDRESNFKAQLKAFRNAERNHGPVAESLWQALLSLSKSN